MKKTYIEPTTLMVKIHTTGLIATSLPKDSVTKVDDNGDVLSREFDYYDDEEFEDE